jgi:hypothetical protein
MVFFNQGLKGRPHNVRIILKVPPQVLAQRNGDLIAAGLLLRRQVNARLSALPLCLKELTEGLRLPVETISIGVSPVARWPVGQIGQCAL